MSCARDLARREGNIWLSFLSSNIRAFGTSGWPRGPLETVFTTFPFVARRDYENWNELYVKISVAASESQAPATFVISREVARQVSSFHPAVIAAKDVAHCAVYS